MLGIGRQWSGRFRSEHATGTERGDLWLDNFPTGLGKLRVEFGVLSGGGSDVVAVHENIDETVISSGARSGHRTTAGNVQRAQRSITLSRQALDNSRVCIAWQRRPACQRRSVIEDSPISMWAKVARDEARIWSISASGMPSPSNS